MDDIVKQAMAKWPNVPHCYGWLGLDARGAWRMRDERAQSLNLAGDKIVHAALVGFINRNYTHDDQGRWYFQNGPQRVYVNLEATPFVAHTDSAQGLVLHTGEPVTDIDAAWLTDTGQLVLQCGEKIILVDDRDMTQCLPRFRLDAAAVEDERLLDWVANPADAHQLTLLNQGRLVPVSRIEYDKLASHFGFVCKPQQD